MYWEHLPSLAELTRLKKIWFECLPSLQVIGQPSQQCSITRMDSYFSSSIETLIIRRCKELKQLPILPPSLVHLELSKVGLTKFPSIGSLHNENIRIKPSKLIFVIVEECASLEGSLLLQAQYIRTIRILCIVDCKELEFVPLLFKEMSELRELSVINCPKLRTSSELEGKILPPSLEKLTIKQSGDIECFVIKSLHGLSNLSELVLENCLSLESLPSPDVCKSLKSLKFMEITGCKNLQTFGGLGSLGHLIALKISACSKLTEVRLSETLHASTPASSASTENVCIEEESLVASASSLLIDYLEVDLPSILNIEPLKSLRHTKGLIIRDGTQMECLPEQWLLQNHKELQSLKALSANSLESLPVCMKELRSLNFLLLSGAEKLRSLSDLPSSLHWLPVMGCCPELETNVRVKDSPEWNKISYIPKVHIATVKTDQSGLHIFHVHLRVPFPPCARRVVLRLQRRKGLSRLLRCLLLCSYRSHRSLSCRRGLLLRLSRKCRLRLCRRKACNLCRRSLALLRLLAYLAGVSCRRRLALSRYRCCRCLALSRCRCCRRLDRRLVGAAPRT
ncbi:hypothetical protein PR202_gb00277 [Eleusine coracana subsp. coracana]|uniref:Disease resistance protein At4g27190-like leucine-rich repeats domain-containing protein n=1 Tax=Eleusine coracana subsp. coracana TaxID=191504 RepID=A0AAV5DTN7_ELECO|nr:hypothetical protein PR202_gb00277 [Eleusine coracana subsp. coracana]